ncbi:MAG: hypothetical protein ACLUFN_03940 [Eubacterium sp.]
MKTIIDPKGKTHKIISKKIDNLGLYIAVFVLDEIYESIRNHIKKENADAFLDVLKKLDDEVGTIICDESTATFVIEQGYNLDD